MSCFIVAPIHAIEEAQQPSSSAWELLRVKYYGDRPMGEVDDAYMSVEVPGNTPDPVAIPSDGSIGAKHILLTRAMSMRLYDRAFRPPERLHRGP